MTDRLVAPEMERYQAHLALPGFGPEGQARLAAARVLLVGVGGLGCPAAQYLVAAGVGVVTLVDDDTVERTNLQRQILFNDDDLGQPKVDAARRSLRGMNAAVAIVARRERLVATNARSIVAGHDMVIDGSDNFATRYVVNDACGLERIPLASGSVYRHEGQVAVFDPPRTPCYRCVFPEALAAEPPCHDAGVLGPVAGIIGTALASIVIQRVVGCADPLAGRLWIFDGATMTAHSVALEQAADCPLCGATPTIFEPTAVAHRSPTS